jgi:cytochrome c551/c552
MPATEKTWRDQLRMHVIFGVSALVMLLATVWMLAKDHLREWRRYELNDRAKQRWTVAAQLAQSTAENQSKRDRLQDELKLAQRGKVDPALVDKFKARVEEEDKRLVEAGGKPAATNFRDLDTAASALAAAQDGSDEAAKARSDVKSQMAGFVSEAKRREDALVTKRKFKAAEQTATISQRGIAIGDQKPRDEIDKIEAIIADNAHVIADMDVKIAAAKDYRMALEAIVRQIDSGEADIQKQITAIDTDLNRLRDNLAANTSNWQEWINRWPILDALYNGNIKLEQIWLPDITINYNFRTVPRYDRCTNCHRAIDATAAGSATEPAYPDIRPGERVRTVELGTPEAAPPAAADASQPPPSLMSVYGMSLAPRGQIDTYAQTIQVVLPGSRAADAGLVTGDIIEKVNGGQVHSSADVDSGLLMDVAWGKPVELTIRRGLAQPFTTHPRLDLYLGSTSPHKMGDFGCTICHDGQGSATDFKWASHTPNDPNQALDWSRKYGWFDNHHWIFPMTPERFVESNCLKCHHEVVELEPSERFPQPPAPKLVEGYKIVQQYGCYGCHEINGFDGPNKRIGPDLRAEPNYYDVAQQILRDPGLSTDEKEWAGTLVHSPDADDLRHDLFRSIKSDASLASASSDAAKGGKPRLTSETHALADALKDVDTPGRYRKVGPSLRHLDSKVDFTWLYAWIRKPSDFRPSTRMPQFFGHFQHLEAKLPDVTITDAQGNEHQITDKEYTERFEAVEVRALAEFLLADSQPFEYLDPPPGVNEAPSAERGKWLFESRGCLACHSHVDFPNIHSTQGPDLSRVAAKFNSAKGQHWLYSWIKAPNRYHVRTAMPNLFLDPIAETDANGSPTGHVTDPAADIAAYLLSVPANWQPEAPVPDRQRMTPDEEKAVEDLTAVWLSANFPKKLAAKYAHDGIPEELAATVKVDEKTLVGNIAADRTQRQLAYVARRSLSRYGCFGCHDIPGYEAVKPIGTPLANWGRKDVSQLAFENITTFLATHGVKDTPAEAEKQQVRFEHGQDIPATTPSLHDHDTHEEPSPEALDPLDFDNDTGYFLTSLNSHQRHGFLWQKLRMPRSFDYATTKTKRYDERLRMPKFPFTEEQREAVMTFVLGLVSEPPVDKYIYHPGPRMDAIVQGRHVLDKYNCAGCHILDMERWKIAFDPKQFDSPPTTSDFPFLSPTFTEDEIKASLTPDRRGLLHADLHGLTARSEATGQPDRVDQDGVAIAPDDTESTPFYPFGLYQPALVAGLPRLVGVQNLLIPAAKEGFGPAEGTGYRTNGGDLAKYLFSRVIAEEHKTSPTAKGSEAWGWLPPPLTMEGGKVQTDWLHDFLMDPTAIRPAVVLRMPNFHMSSTEASKLVNYFAAKGSAEFPYEYNARRRADYVGQLEQLHPKYFDDAMRIVTDGNYCVKCHTVADYHPKGAIKTQGPNLAEVYRRLRPDYVRRWIGNPSRILPYTGMPVNIPYDASAPHQGGVSQSLFAGTSTEQLDGLVDLLMNFDNYARRHTSVKSLVKEPAGESGKSALAEPPRSDQSAQQ